MKPISVIALSAALLCPSSAYSNCQKTILLVGQSNAVRMAKYGDMHGQAKAIFPDCKIIFRGSLRSGTPIADFMPNLHVIDTTDRYQFREDNTHLVTEAYRNAVHDALILTELVMAAPVVSQNAGGVQ